MDAAPFWAIVDEAKSRAGADPYVRVEALKLELARLAPEEIVAFDTLYQKQIARAYRWNLWGAAFVINGGCSDDGFRYFCDFLISEGQVVFEAALEDPESLSELGDIEDAELESFGYAAFDAYEDRTGSEMPMAPVDFPAEPAGEAWDEDTIGNLFPKLAAQYW